MWTVIYMARSKNAVLSIQKLLTESSVSVKVHPVGKEDQNVYYEILVPETESQSAHEILIKNGY